MVMTDLDSFKSVFHQEDNKIVEDEIRKKFKINHHESLFVRDNKPQAKQMSAFYKMLVQFYLHKVVENDMSKNLQKSLNTMSESKRRIMSMNK